MKAPARLGLYGLVLVAVFAVAGFTANAVIPETAVQAWTEDTEENTHHQGGEDMATPPGLARSAWASRSTATSSPPSQRPTGSASRVSCR